MGDFHIKRIILPSGKAVEIVYFDPEGETDEAAHRGLAEALHVPPSTPQIAPQALEECPTCDSRLVYPIDWREATFGRWELELRCPNCEWGVRDTYSQELVEAFDETLNVATDRVIEVLDQWSKENMSEEIDRFVLALQLGHIQPFDF